MARTIVAEHGQVALFVSESPLPDGPVLASLERWRALVPTALRIIVAHVDRFLADIEMAESANAAGRADAYLMIPRGPRDEEFRAAVTELLSDWGATVPTQEAEAVSIAASGDEPLTLRIRDFLERMGMPYRMHDRKARSASRSWRSSARSTGQRHWRPIP